jgi:hypothetical protein
MQRARDRARVAGAPPRVLARYDAEVERLRAWIADGAPVPPPYVPADELDELTRRALVYDAGRTFDPDPDAPASLSLDLPGGLPLGLPDAGLSDAERLRSWGGLVHEWVRQIAKGLATGDPEERKALAVIVDHPPPGVRRKGWTPSRARLLYAYRGLREAMADADQPWRGRIGSGENSAIVDGTPADAGIVGAMKWLQQEAPKYARAALLDHAAEYADPNRRDLRDPLEVDWPADHETGTLLALPDEGSPGALDVVAKLSEALLVASPQQRAILMARWDPDLDAVMEEAAEAAGMAMSDEDRELLRLRCDSLAEVQEATGAQVRVQMKRLRDKLAL